MENCKLVHDDIFDFKLKDSQIVNAAAFNSIFQKLSDNDRSLLTVKDKYTYGPKTNLPVEDYWLSAEGSKAPIANPAAIKHLSAGYKVWQNINYTQTNTEAIPRVIPGSRASDYDILVLNQPSAWLSAPYDKSESTYIQYRKKITNSDVGGISAAWSSSFEQSNLNHVDLWTQQAIDLHFKQHVTDWHQSDTYDKERNLALHQATVKKEDNKAIVISADLPSSIKKFSSKEQLQFKVKNPFTFTQRTGHSGTASDTYKDVDVTPTAVVIEYASGMKNLYVNIPSTKTYWIPFVVPKGLQYEDGYINFFNLPFDPSVTKSQFPERNYFGLGEDSNILFGGENMSVPRPQTVDASSGTFVTDFKLTIRGLNISTVYTAIMSNESPALNRIQFGYSKGSTGKFNKQHGGDNSWYPPSILVEQPEVASDGSVVVHGCCFGSDSQNLMLVCQ